MNEVIPNEAKQINEVINEVEINEVINQYPHYRTYKYPIVEKPTENIINQDDYYIYLENDLYSISRERYVYKYKMKRSKKEYCRIMLCVYDKNNPHMKISNSKKYVRYYF